MGWTAAVKAKDIFFSHFTANEGAFFEFLLLFDDVDKRLRSTILLEDIQPNQYHTCRKILYLFQKNAIPH